MSIKDEAITTFTIIRMEETAIESKKMNVFPRWILDTKPILVIIRKETRIALFFAFANNCIRCSCSLQT